jgi:hypothetical protein
MWQIEATRLSSRDVDVRIVLLVTSRASCPRAAPSRGSDRAS